jgi:hypothetical protein
MANLIVQENQLPGSPDTEWDLAGAASTNIEGFATDISFNRGDTVSFKINTNSANYRIDIYRLGYYGGRGARKLATLLQTTASVQPPPIINSSIGLVDAGNWHVSAVWVIPTGAVSGVYLAHLVRQDGTRGENHIPSSSATMAAFTTLSFKPRTPPGTPTTVGVDTTCMAAALTRAAMAAPTR